MYSNSTTVRATGRRKILRFRPRRASGPDPALEAARRELAADWRAWRRERDRLDGEEAALLAWAACLRARERQLAARTTEATR